MGVCKGNIGNLMQHWVLAEVIHRLAEPDLLPAKQVHLLLVTTHSMAPWSVPRAQADYAFNAARRREPARRNSHYESAWHGLSVRQGVPYPSSAALAVKIWPSERRRLSLLLCENDRSVADEIEGWLALPEIAENVPHRVLHRGDWRARFSQPLAMSSPLPDAIFIEMDPMRFESHPPAHAEGATLYAADLRTIVTNLENLRGVPTVLQNSSFSANNNNPHDIVAAVVDGILAPADFVLQARVEADGNMISLVYSTDLHLWDRAEDLNAIFHAWLRA